jgi:hypothetical protein
MIDGYDELTRAGILEAIRRDWAAWQNLVERVGPRLDEPGVEGDWSVKDIVAHIGAYERLLLRALGGNAREYPEPPAEVDMADMDQRNAWFHTVDRSRTVDEVLAEADDVHQRLVAAIEARSDHDLHELRIYPWSDRPLWRVIVGETFDHYGQHLEPLRTWLRAASSKP